jgi:hypothetical protein
VLAIIGLAGASRNFDAIADILVGAAFLFAAWSLMAREEHERGVHERGLWEGRIAGVAGIVLGILALLHLAPDVLAPVAVIVFGGALVLGRGVGRMGRIIVGVGATVLGILALLHLDPRTLTLIALIAVAGILLLSSPIERSAHRARAAAT